MLREVAAATGRRIVFFCAFGERSAMAVKAAKDAGLANTAHIEGGIDAWKKAGGVAGSFGSVLSGLALDPRTSQLRDQHVKRVRQHDAAAHRQPVRNHDAFRRRIETLQRRMQQEGAAVILGSVAGVRHHNEIRLQIHDPLQRGESAKGDAKLARRVEQTGLGQQ